MLIKQSNDTLNDQIILSLYIYNKYIKISKLINILQIFAHSFLSLNFRRTYQQLEILRPCLKTGS